MGQNQHGKMCSLSLGSEDKQVTQNNTSGTWSDKLQVQVMLKEGHKNTREEATLRAMGWGSCGATTEC